MAFQRTACSRSPCQLCHISSSLGWGVEELAASQLELWGLVEVSGTGVLSGLGPLLPGRALRVEVCAWHGVGVGRQGCCHTQG